MIQIPTVSHHLEKSGSALSLHFAQLLERDYPRVHSTLEAQHLSLLARIFYWRGTSREKPVVLMAHFDVVPAERADGWTDDPFSGEIRDGAVWGRGSLDDKGQLVVLLDAVENLLAAGFVPPQDVYLCFGGNEETYGTAASDIAAEFNRRGIVPWLVLDEGGAVVKSPFAAIATPIAAIGVAEKGLATVKLRVAGDPGHASAPSKDAPVAHLARAITRIETLRFRVSLPRPLRQMLAGFAPHTSLGYRLVLSNMWLFHGLVARVFAARGGETEAMTHTTIAVTRVEAGSADNVLPSSASATLNIRIALGDSVAGVVAAVRKRIADPTVSIEIETPSEPSPISSSTNEQFALLRGAVDEAYPGTITSPYVMMAATDARHLHDQTPHVYRFSPLAMTEEQRAGIHGVNEHVTIDSLERGERFYRWLISALPR
jgi:carboxypeptidase PM20D1